MHILYIVYREKFILPPWNPILQTSPSWTFQATNLSKINPYWVKFIDLSKDAPTSTIPLRRGEKITPTRKKKKTKRTSYYHTTSFPSLLPPKKFSKERFLSQSSHHPIILQFNVPLPSPACGMYRNASALLRRAISINSLRMPPGREERCLKASIMKKQIFDGTSFSF